MVAMYAPVAPKQATTETFSPCSALVSLETSLFPFPLPVFDYLLFKGKPVLCTLNAFFSESRFSNQFGVNLIK